MKSRFVYLMVAMLAACTLSINLAWAQSSSGDITGRVVDPSGAPVVGAEVTLTDQATAETRVNKTDGSGDFVFASVQPGTYMVSVQASGFKQFEKRNLHLSSNERLPAGTLKLEVGAVTETMTVEAAATTVQTESGERSALLDSNEISSLMSIGRDVSSLVRVLPGVVKDDLGNDTLGQTQNAGNINGTRTAFNTLSADGVVGNTRGNPNMDTGFNMDSVAEVKILSNNYQAEYGSRGGAIVNLVTKSGGRDFHGSVYYYGRNEDLNANKWIDNQAQRPRTQYRFNTIGGNIGGPIMIPKLFNTRREKLFFFYSEEDWPTHVPSNAAYESMPTDAERMGDFSNSYDSKGNKILIMDPNKPANTCKPGGITTGCFPGNIIPSNRQNANSQALLNLFPHADPNCAANPLSCVAPNGNLYNYFSRGTDNQPTHQHLLRVDYAINDKWHMFLRGMETTANNNGQNVPSVTGAMQWGIPFFYNTPGSNIVANFTYVANANLVNEINVGWSAWNEQSGFVNKSDQAKFQRQNVANLSLGQYNPSQNPLNLVPRLTYGGGGGTNSVLGNTTFSIGNAPQVQFDNRFPLNNFTQNYQLTDGVTYTWGHHTSKAGVFLQLGRYVQEHIGSVFDGTVAFDASGSSALESGDAYANAVLGNYSSYTEGIRVTNYAPQWRIVEFYLQDSWKMKSNFTVEYGVRFTYDIPSRLQPGNGAAFFASQYNPALVPQLYYPTKNCPAAFGKRCASLVPGGTGPGVQDASFIGLFVQGQGTAFPNGYQFPGSVLNTTPGFPNSLRNGNGLLAAPRLGFAWDPFKDGKTAVRGGAGLIYDPGEGGGTLGDYSLIAPVTYNPSQGVSNITTLAANIASGKPLGFGPQSTRVLQVNRPITTIFNATLGIQRRVGLGIVADVAYVGSWGRHVNEQVNLNANPYNSNFNPANFDLSQGTKTFNTPYGVITQQPALSGNFFVPTPGYGSIDLRNYGSSSNYNSLQAQLTKRFTKGLEFGVAWTWSKAMDYVDADDGGVANFQPLHFWNYGEAGFDRTHNIVAHWLWDMPKASHLWNNFFTRGVFDNWQYSGIATFVSGAPMGVSIASASGGSGLPDFTGGGDGVRPIVTGNPVLPKSQQSIYGFFNTSVFVMPPAPTLVAGKYVNTYVPGPGTLGMVGRDVFRGPGGNDFDMALEKNIPIREKVTFKLRAEAYNVFNHPTFNAVNTTVQFDTSTKGGGQLLTGPKNTAGWITGDRGARIMQLSGRINF